MVWWCVTLDWLPAEPADIDYIMELIARYCGQDPEKVEISREQFIGLIRSDARFLDERSDISEHVHSLEEGDGLDQKPVPAGHQRFKVASQARETEQLAHGHGLSAGSLTVIVDTILRRMIFGGEQFTDLMASFRLGWRVHREREFALMADLVLLLNKRSHGRNISGLNAYEHGDAR